ncbi:N-acetylglucosamine-6-phosphate deacetylase [Williamsoniiplasma somnilux]|uniref:N-acetylglucosamine-6-phosphate deacetylase n=1 Tax=Williamsoniiplasma somnilux TaxID=215578 RepID=A0A2K8NY30_9MOLU|nr:N-acetylglucosamine-6-phosphate deacetylase [Williamsoniiplasma somnilux]ATZ18730.1 N-acetylglucosamine-6-phosphate deacetylase [Williamsoniiplasma somnilux]
MILKNGKIVLEHKIIEKGYLVIHDKKIIDIVEGTTDEFGVDLKGNWVLPGFIDCHVHGGYGVDFETGDTNRFEHFALNVGKEGITKYCQASITNSLGFTNKIYKEFGDFMSKSNKQGAICLGAHMEGPFISPAKKGAHDPKLLINPDIEITKHWNELAKNNIKIITYAGELQDGSYTKYLIENDILPSIGHTDMLAQEFDKDWKLGVKHITHLFNGMSGVDHYRPGLAVAALNHDDVVVEVISDGIHLQPEILKMIFDHKGPDKISIITDAMNAKGLPDGEYKIGQLPVIKTGMKVALKDSGVLAAAGATYDHNVRVYYNTCKMEMTDLIKMTSINAAKQLNVYEQTGSLAPNKLADIVVLDKNLKVLKTIAEGRVIFENNEY